WAELSRHCWRTHKSGYGYFYAVRGRPKAERSPGDTWDIQMHRQILGTPRGKLTDHRNLDGLDNRRENLRVADASSNAANCGKYRRRNGTASKFKGVYWLGRKRRWPAVICRGRRDHRLGHFPPEVEAAMTYNAAAVKLFGEFARINDISVDDL